MKNEALKQLCLSCGVNGVDEAAKTAAALLGELCDRVETDAMGNVIARRRGGDDTLPTLVLEAHNDQIGFIVTSIDEHGFLQIDQCGYVDNRVLTGAAVTVYGDQPYAGVFCSVPPHLGGGTMPEVSQRFVDVGMTAEEAKKHVPVGSRVSFCPKYESLLGDRVTATSLDNRAGVATVLRTLELLKEDTLFCRVAVMLATQEEISHAGAICATFHIDPAAAIAVDVSFAMTPGDDASECGELGKGPMIGFSPVLDLTYSRDLCRIAEQEKIPYQLEGMGNLTGTDADRMTTIRGGVRTALISVPLRNMHTPAEIADLNDIENSARLMAAFVRQWEAKVC